MTELTADHLGTTRERLAVWTAAFLVLALFIGTSGLWPWDHDEVLSLVEIGIVPLREYPGPVGQMERMHRLIPMWQLAQSGALSFLPHNELGTRLLPAACGSLVVILGLVGGRRARGRWFGWSLFVMVAGSQTLIWLSQQNRFYSLALLWTTLTVLLIWWPDSRRRYDLLVALTAVAALLSHNLTLIVFALAGIAAAAAWLSGSMPTVAARRAMIAAAATTAMYLFYVRPLLGNWLSGNTGGTSPLVSFVAQVGIAPVALSCLGAAIALTRRDPRAFHWWVFLLVLGVGFVTTASWSLGNWNPRYGLFFMPPVWVLAALACSTVAESLSPRLAPVWLATVVVLLLPKFGSHFIDGSRHDFRTAAQVVATRAATTPVVSNWPATLQYYLAPATGQHPTYWQPGQPLPPGPTTVALASNAWDPVLSFGGRPFVVIGQIGHRRWDEQSHLIRIYDVR